MEPKLVEIKPKLNYRLWMKFSDGVEGDVDLSSNVGKGVFSLWNNPAKFNEVKIGKAGELCWNDEVDIDSTAMYLRITGKNPEDIFPALKEKVLRA
jgi:hypothetical protein